MGESPSAGSAVPETALSGLTVDRRWVFGRAVLDERSMELVVGGRLAPIERKPLEVLLFLLHHAGEVVTKDELAENLWPGRILSETVLTRCISVLRQALGDEQREVIKTVHGFGYRLASEIKVESSTGRAPLLLKFRPGDTPPLRHQWKLVERLGSGGHGEAWLVHHDKTRDARVFKFALDERALTSLKREITLYRLLNDSLGAQAPIRRILEWNLEEPPYFLEAEYVAGGNLQTWGDSQGGLQSIPLIERLELMAQIAEAVAAAHSVGALHKDLKPGNVLVEATTRRIKLCDFGSGGIADPARLEALGITRHGFTRTMDQSEISGTPLYLAPEVLAGQPFTVQADVYALGVLLYQMVVGDLRKALAPGWELDVGDDLLRGDIAETAAGNPSRRLNDAARLAERLRSLDERHQTRAAKIEATTRAEKARRALEDLKRIRVVATLLLAMLGAAITGGVATYQARDEALAATATARAISAFLMEDVLTIDPSNERPKDASYESLLNRAAARGDERLRQHPEAAVSVHWLLGRRYHEIGHVESAIEQFEAAARLLPSLTGRAMEPALFAMERLLALYWNNGKRGRASAMAQELLRQWTALHGPIDFLTLQARIRIAKQLVDADHLDKAAAELQEVLRLLPFAKSSPDTQGALRDAVSAVVFSDMSALNSREAIERVLSAQANAIMGGILVIQGDYAESLRRGREAVSEYRASLGEDHELTARARLTLGGSLTVAGSYSEAERTIAAGARYLRASLPEGHWYHAIVDYLYADLYIEQGRPAQALVLLEEGPKLRRLGIWSPRYREEARYAQALAHLALGQWTKAIEILRISLTNVGRLFGNESLACLKRRVSLTEALRLSGRFDQASTMLSTITPGMLKTYERTIAAASFHREVALLEKAKGNLLRAKNELGIALDSLTKALGTNHRLARRASAEFADLQRLAASHASNSSGGSAGVKK